MPNFERFWSRVDKTDSCWLWKGRRKSHGYAVISVGGQPRYAHRLAYEMAYGHVPKGFMVCHRCDVRHCVRPDHLYLGTNNENMADMARKGRACGGNRRTLTQQQAREIRLLRFQKGRSLRDLAEQFGTSIEVVSHILHNRTYVERIILQPTVPTGEYQGSPLPHSGSIPFEPTLEERFWSKVRVENGCWVWMGSYYRAGYGRFHVNRQSRYAHRVAFELRNGPIPGAMRVLHKCDNRSCVNPLGTQAENVRDTIRKGRHKPPLTRGEYNGRARLTPADVKQIRQWYADAEMGPTQMARHFGVRVGTICHILKGRTWRHLS